MNDLGQWFPTGEEFHEFRRNFHFVVELPIQCNSCASFKVDIGFLNYFYHFMLISDIGFLNYFYHFMLSGLSHVFVDKL